MTKLTKMQCARYIVMVLYNSQSLPDEHHGEVERMVRFHTLKQLVDLYEMAIRARQAGNERMQENR